MEAGAATAALTLGTAFDASSDGAVYLHGERLVSTILEGQVVPPCQVAEARERLPSLTHAHGVIHDVLCKAQEGPLGQRPPATRSQGACVHQGH